jgi:3-hydroxymyristoyl/3-hydroxydecanoyl-(acyl carrier protein) dehydratase
MLSQWHKLGCVCSDESDRFKVIATAPHGSLWFDGHFPGKPILPGIALISMAFELAREQEACRGNSIRLKTVKRVRFKKPVRPDEPFTVEVKREQKESGLAYIFTIKLAGEAGCTGILAVEMIS